MTFGPPSKPIRHVICIWNRINNPPSICLIDSCIEPEDDNIIRTSVLVYLFQRNSQQHNNVHTHNDAIPFNLQTVSLHHSMTKFLFPLNNIGRVLLRTWKTPTDCNIRALTIRQIGSHIFTFHDHVCMTKVWAEKWDIHTPTRTQEESAPKASL